MCKRIKVGYFEEEFSSLKVERVRVGEVNFFYSLLCKHKNKFVLMK